MQSSDAAPTMRAATYVRMSTEHQKYSPEHQRAVLAAYALSRGYEIVRTYADEGISGLRLETRPGLKHLLADVLAGGAGFEKILVYDVSRWGRFQDPDQSAHYEFLCKEAGVTIEYCTEPFENDGSLTSTLVKHLKRAMAAEYSRELSARISRSRHGLSMKGYWQGGPCGYGLRRLLVDAEGAPIRILQAGERKALLGGRIVLVPGPPEEVETVRRIFRLFAITGMSRSTIMRTLNEEGVAAIDGGPWTVARIRIVLTNERYIGTHVFGKYWTRLGSRGARSRDSWFRVRGAWIPLIPEDLYRLAERHIHRYKPHVSNAELVAELEQLLRRKGRLSISIIDQDDDTHSVATYVNRLGGLRRAYELAGYQPSYKQMKAAHDLRTRLADYYWPTGEPPSDEELLRRISAVLQSKGRLSNSVLNEHGLHAQALGRRFGGMRRLYALVGYTPTKAQERAMDIRGGQSVTREQAAEIRAHFPTPSAP